MRVICEAKVICFNLILKLSVKLTFLKGQDQEIQDPSVRKTILANIETIIFLREEFENGLFFDSINLGGLQLYCNSITSSVFRSAIFPIMYLRMHFHQTHRKNLSPFRRTTQSTCSVDGQLSGVFERNAQTIASAGTDSSARSHLWQSVQEGIFLVIVRPQHLVYGGFDLI